MAAPGLFYSFGGDGDRPTRAGKRPKVDDRKEKRTEAAKVIRAACSAMFVKFAEENVYNGRSSAPACSLLQTIIVGVIRIIQTHVPDNKMWPQCAYDVETVLASLPRSNAQRVSVTDFYGRIAKILDGTHGYADGHKHVGEWLARDGIRRYDVAPTDFDPDVVLANAKMTVKHAIPFLDAMVGTGLADESLEFWTNDKNDTWPDESRSFSGAVGKVFRTVLRTKIPLSPDSAVMRALPHPYYKHVAADVAVAFRLLADAFAAANAVEAESDADEPVPVEAVVDVRRLCSMTCFYFNAYNSVAAFIAFLKGVLPDVFAIMNARPVGGETTGLPWPECATDVMAALARWERATDWVQGTPFTEALCYVVRMYGDAGTRATKTGEAKATIRSFMEKEPLLARRPWSGPRRYSPDVFGELLITTRKMYDFIGGLQNTGYGDRPLADWTGDPHDLSAYPGGAITNGIERAFHEIVALLPDYSGFTFTDQEYKDIRAVETALPVGTRGSGIQKVKSAYATLQVAITHLKEASGRYQQLETELTRSGRAERHWTRGILKVYMPSYGEETVHQHEEIERKTHVVHDDVTGVDEVVELGVGISAEDIAHAIDMDARMDMEVDAMEHASIESEREADPRAVLVEMPPVGSEDGADSLFDIVVVSANDKYERLVDYEVKYETVLYVAQHVADTGAIVIDSKGDHKSWETRIAEVPGMSTGWLTRSIYTRDARDLTVMVRDKYMVRLLDAIRYEKEHLSRKELYDRLLDASNQLRLQHDMQRLELAQMSKADTA